MRRPSGFSAGKIFRANASLTTIASVELLVSLESNTRPLRDSNGWASEDLKRHHLVWLLSAQRQVRGYCRARHRWKLFHTLQYVIIKTRLRVGFGIAGTR